VHEGLLLKAVKATWLTKNQARIDDVVDYLMARDSGVQRIANHPQPPR
jgi:conjugal transfer ATP-binding protein TraC